MEKWAGIEEFVAVAEAESFTRAARRLGVSISQVSREVIRLEERLQTRLLHRTTRRVALTAAGRTFHARCRRLIEDRVAAFAELGEEGDELKGHIRITCATTYGERFIVPLVNEFISRHPKVSIDLDLTNQVVDLIAEGFDIGIRLGRVADSRLLSRPLTTRTQHLSASPGYLRHRSAPQSIAEIQSHDCLLGTADRWSFSAGDEEIRVKPPARWRCNSGNAVREAALQGLGLCQLPNYYVEQDFKSGALIELLTAHRPPAEHVWVVTHEGSDRPHRTQRLIDFLLEQAHIQRPDAR